MTLESAVLATLAYHDIFNYPLTAGEITNYLIAKKATESLVEKELAKLVKSKKIGENRLLYFLKNRQKIVKIRLQRQKYSQEKLQRAKLYSKLLTLIPTVQLIAISGALAMGNSHKKDDIDLVLISQKNTLWTTRFLANTILFPFKRKPAQLQTTRFASEACFARRARRANYKLPTNNKACLNIFIEEGDLKITPQNLYTAHEICQMKPIWDREATYSQFISANNWVKKFLPNWRSNVERLTTNARNKKNGHALVLKRLALVAESFFKNFQLWYMRPKITTEKIGNAQLFFHPSDTPEWVLKEYRKRIKRLKVASKIISS